MAKLQKKLTSFKDFEGSIFKTVKGYAFRGFSVRLNFKTLSDLKEYLNLKMLNRKVLLI
jgi:hypothetical protein